MSMKENIESLINEQPGKTRAEKVSNLKKEAARRRGVMSINPVINAIDKLDDEGNFPKRVPAKPIEDKDTSPKRVPAKPTGGGGGGGMFPDTERVPGKKPLKMKAGGSVGIAKKLPAAKQMGSMAMKAGGSVKRKADGVAKRGLTKGKMMRGGGMCK